MLCMNIAQGNKHMSRNEENKHSYLASHKLGAAQYRVLVCLSERGPQTIYSCAKRKGTHSTGNYHSIHNAFKSLMKKGQIKKVHVEGKHPLYWLTNLGILNALALGTKPSSLIRISQNAFPNDTLLHSLLELLSIIPKDWILFFVEAIDSNGDLNYDVFLNLMMGYSLLLDEKQLQTLIEKMVSFININPDLQKYRGLFRESFDKVDQWKTALNNKV